MTVPHLHGGVIPMRHDGHPDFQFPPGTNDTYVFPNGQRAAMLWYHDHSLGLTRLNVYMGLAGAYILRDALETGLKLPSGKYEMPLVIMDRDFNSDGSLRYQSQWASSFFGKYYVVNGKVRRGGRLQQQKLRLSSPRSTHLSFLSLPPPPHPTPKVHPFMRVERKTYRFRIVNACNSRVLTLEFSRKRFWVIGTDGGLLARRDKLKRITIAPGERTDIMYDFSNIDAGYRVELRNRQPAQHGETGLVKASNSDVIMQFHVVDSAAKKRKPPKHLDRDLERLYRRGKFVERVFRLYEKPDTCGGKKLTVNGLGWDAVTEFPRRNSREMWLFANLDGSHMHPMHLHLAHFQLWRRQPLQRLGEDNFVLVGDEILPERHEKGWKDTIHVGPLEAVTVVVEFPGDYAGRFPYHCHALEHEDHDMMRQFWITQDGCNENGVCDAGEDCFSCPEDCGGLTSGARCGNGLCEAGDGENCATCSEDCGGDIGGVCCGTGDLVFQGATVGSTTTGCADEVCTTGGRRCRASTPVKACCGDSVCTGNEEAGTCPIDCA